jgi:hypothetical protein
MGRRMGDERGMALMMVLMLAAIALAVTSALLYTIAIGTRMSGSQKRYESAIEAATGGLDVSLGWVGSRETPDLGGSIPVWNTPEPCFTDKLTKGTENWDPSCSASSAIDISISSSYDLTYTLGGYSIYAKIVNTIEGNTATTGGGGTGLISTGVIHSSSSEVPVKPVSYLYTIEIETRNATNPATMAERARLNVLYQQ